MSSIIQKTIGGLSKQYYFRQFTFGVAIAAFMLFFQTQGGRSLPNAMLLFTIVSTLLYPYSRFVYESIFDFLIGKNVFFINAIPMLFIKSFTMLMCWGFAIFVAPIGFIYLYFYHNKVNE